MNLRLFLIALCLLSVVGWLVACSGDDPGAPPPTVDRTPPQVIASEPMDSTGGADLHEPVTVHFSEPMDPATADGNFTLTGTTIVATTWVTDRALRVNHDGFAEGAEVTLTLGTGLADVAGNGLATDHVVTFRTTSPTELVVMTISPDDGSTGAPVNTGITVRLSEHVETTEIESGITLSDQAGKATFGFTARDIRFHTYLLMPVDELPAETSIHVHVSDQLTAGGGQTPAAPYLHTFTTGAARDTTPPAIVAVEPPNGTTEVSPNQGFVRFTFSEPIARWAAPAPVNLAYDLIRSGYFGEMPFMWNAERTQLTLGLPSDLPPGLPLEMTHDFLEDWNGMQETARFHYGIRVAGDPDYLPIVDGARYTDDTVWDSGSLGEPPDEAERFRRERIAVHELSADTFHEVGYFNANPGGDPYGGLSGAWDAYRLTGDALAWLGWQEAPEDPAKSHDFDQPLTVLPLPLAAGTWTDAASVTPPDEDAYTLDLAGKVLPQQDYTVLAGRRAVFVKDAWVAVLEFRKERMGDLVATRRDTVVYAPCLGRVHTMGYEEDLELDTWRREHTWRRPYSETILFGVMEPADR